MTIVKTTDSGGTTQQLMTADDLARLPDDGSLHELVEGVLVEMPRPKYRHGRVQGKLAALVGHHIYTQQLGDLLAESGFMLARDPDIVRGPDLAFVTAGRTLPYDEQERYYDGAPDLAVEIVSPNDNAVGLRELIDLYFAASAQLVWVIYPMFRAIEVHHPDGSAILLRADDRLDGESVLPGFSVLVRALFE